MENFKKYLQEFIGKNNIETFFCAFNTVHEGEKVIKHFVHGKATDIENCVNNSIYGLFSMLYENGYEWNEEQFDISEF